MAVNEEDVNSSCKVCERVESERNMHVFCFAKATTPQNSVWFELAYFVNGIAKGRVSSGCVVVDCLVSESSWKIINARHTLSLIETN